jgi:acetylornithine deacetylase/succinyl-diaminopimelate desuccinylase-like protein
MKNLEHALQYTEDTQNELIQLIKDLCAIPSFSHHELKKAQFIQSWFAKLGVDAIVDEKYNVIVPIDADNKNQLTVFMAHIDTVFPDETGFDCVEKDGWLCAPGVGDDTANVAELMLIAKYMIENGLGCPNGCLIVFNSCEEGLGNLEGSRYLMDTYGNRVHEFYSFDGGYKGIVCKAVGSVRYEVVVKTEGGHSYGAFGNRNAIALASSMICTLYDYKVPTRGKSTYNVGVIEGGTSVNTIAQEVKFMFEVRSDEREDLLEMKQFFESVINAYRCMGIFVDVNLLGERPCMGNVDMDHLQNVLTRVAEVIQHHTGNLPSLHSGSTDCNICYDRGVAGCCFGGYEGKGAHTRQERIEINSLPVGMKILMHFMLEYFD